MIFSLSQLFGYNWSSLGLLNVMFIRYFLVCHLLGSRRRRKGNRHPKWKNCCELSSRFFIWMLVVCRIRHRIVRVTEPKSSRLKFHCPSDLIRPEPSHIEFRSISLYGVLGMGTCRSWNLPCIVDETPLEVLPQRKWVVLLDPSSPRQLIQIRTYTPLNSHILNQTITAISIQ